MATAVRAAAARMVISQLFMGAEDNSPSGFVPGGAPGLGPGLGPSTRTQDPVTPRKLHSDTQPLPRLPVASPPVASPKTSPPPPATPSAPPDPPPPRARRRSRNRES